MAEALRANIEGVFEGVGQFRSNCHVVGTSHANYFCLDR